MERIVKVCKGGFALSVVVAKFVMVMAVRGASVSLKVFRLFANDTHQDINSPINGHC